MQSREDDPYEGLEFVVANGTPVYTKDPFYLAGGAAIPTVIVMLLVSQLPLGGSTVETAIILVGVGLSIATGYYLYQADIDDIPDALSYPALAISEESLTDGGEMAYFDPAGTDETNFRLRIVGEDDAWEVTGETRGWRTIPREFNRISTESDAAPSSIVSMYGDVDTSAVLDLERVSPKIDADKQAGTWRLR